jgi:hypothetical protein
MAAKSLSLWITLESEWLLGDLAAIAGGRRVGVAMTPFFGPIGPQEIRSAEAEPLSELVPKGLGVDQGIR